jgi:hypothetical protein
MNDVKAAIIGEQGGEPTMTLQHCSRSICRKPPFGASNLAVGIRYNGISTCYRG